MFKSKYKKTYLQKSSKKRLMRDLTAMIIALGMSTMVSAKNSNNFVSNAHLPTNAKSTCTADIASWFPNGHITANGWVKPANSLDPVFADFKNNTLCDFYKWGAQMFLWMTSGDETRHVFNTSPGFYNVSVEENKQRTFLQSGGPMLLGVRKGKTDEEIELGQAGGGDVLLSQDNSLVYYGLHANDVFALYTTGQKNKAFNNALGWISVGEDAACLAQYESCASEIKGFCKDQLNTCTHNNFPSTLDQMRIVQNFATNYGYSLESTQLNKKPYTSPMAIELKTSWIDATKWSKSKQKDYVLTQAIVPVFDRSKTKGPWPVTGNKKKTLAMVGMHVVGTVNGHPEMIWSTFEHVNNVPDNTYTYTSSTNQPAIQPYQSKWDWNFLPSNASAPTSITSNAQALTVTDGTLTSCILSVPTSQNPNCTDAAKATNPDIAPIDVLRVDPWGNQHGDNSNANVSNNTDLVSINVSVLSQLKTGDIRGNYIQTGGVWTAKGQIPPGFPNTKPSYLRGSLNLANTTMETFYQFQHPGKNAFNPENCFGCHGSTYIVNQNGTGPTGVSHIFGALQPLPKK